MISDGEVFVLLAASVASVIGLIRLNGARMPSMYFRDASGAGLVRLAVLGALGWMVYVLCHHADSSVVGFYRLFYLIQGLAAVLWFGIAGARLAGIRYRVDVMERGNRHAALVVAAMTLATGLIAGGCVWGEADPDGEGEGGWWIPAGFFLAGWCTLAIALRFYAWRDTHGVPRRMRWRHKMGDAQACALYLLSTGWILMRAVSGDFMGWIGGLLDVGAVAGMLAIHEIMGAIAGRGEDPHTAPPAATPRARLWEALAYVLWAVGYGLVRRWLPQWAAFL